MFPSPSAHRPARSAATSWGVAAAFAGTTAIATIGLGGGALAQQSNPNGKPIGSSAGPGAAKHASGVPQAGATARRYGTYLRPFAADSPWNRIPINPVLDHYVLPKTRYFPFVGTGAYTTGSFLAKPTDQPVTVQGLNNAAGAWNTDDGQFKPVSLPRWPADVLPASGTDGHADIIDPASNKVHSFWQLRKIDGIWKATQYAWSALDGRGWSDPAYNHQGARAAGVPTTGGLIRKHELDDGDSLFRHVVAITLDGSALKRGYVYPATAEDNHSIERYKGEIPMGSLLMLPANFDTASIKTPALRKLAETLKRYGGAVVDLNDDTRYAIPVEQGAVFDLHAGGWNSAAGDDLSAIGDGLRRVLAVDGWLDGNGRPIRHQPALNLLSMRGPWHAAGPDHAIRYDSWRQALIFSASDKPIVATQASTAHRRTSWAPWTPARRFQFSVDAGGGAKLRLQFRQPDHSILWESADLGNGQKIDFVMPQDTERPTLVATSGNAQTSWVRGSLRETAARPQASCGSNDQPCVAPTSIRK